MLPHNNVFIQQIGSRFSAERRAGSPGVLYAYDLRWPRLIVRLAYPATGSVPRLSPGDHELEQRDGDQRCRLLIKKFGCPLELRIVQLASKTARNIASAGIALSAILWREDRCN